MEIKGNYGKVIFGDSLELLNLNHGKQFEVALIDPPFNINLQFNINNGIIFKNKYKQKKLYYEDDRIDYEVWCSTWFNMLKNIADNIIIYCGNLNLAMWYKIATPLDNLVYFTPFNMIITPTAWAGRFKPILIYANDKNNFLRRKFKTSVFVKRNTIKREVQHPCPVDYNLWYDILNEIKPKSVIDIFMGSGTTAMACEHLSIPYLGYEQMKEFYRDINKSIKQGIKLNKPKRIIKKLGDY